MPTPVTFPLDTSGVASSNLVQNELHTVSESRIGTYNFIIPYFSPIFIDNFEIVISYGNTTRTLVEDVDFSFALPYVTGTRTTGKQMYGGVTLHDLNLNGILSLRYQTIGGDQVADRLQVLTLLADKAYNPRTTIWDILTNVPNAFPPVPHFQDYDTFFGQEEVVNALGEIRDAILQNSTNLQEELVNLLDALIGSSSTFVSKNGDTMLGKLVLFDDPSEDMDAVTKRYMLANSMSQDEINTILASYYTSSTVDILLDNRVAKAGDTMTGFLTLNADPINDEHAATKRYIDTIRDDLITQINTVSSTSNLDQSVIDYVDNKMYEVMSYIDSFSSRS